MAADADLFKDEFKRYKKRSADLSDVIDFRNPEQYEAVVSLPSHTSPALSREAAVLGLSPPSHWQHYTLTTSPGLIVIPDPFRPGCQHRWVRQCLVEYPLRPNVCNLDAHVRREGDGQLWPKRDGERGSVLKLCSDDLLYKLRWVTLGYHYDWNTKEYYDDQRSPFPKDLSHLSSFILKIAGFSQFSPEAAIVNYYHLDSTLSGHTDHSERDLSLPLLSISFGQSAVFLIGGQSKAVRPKALLLRSGDVVIMSGPSRLAFHGVPKVISPTPTSHVPNSLTAHTLAGGIESEGQDGHDCPPTCPVCGMERGSSLTEGKEPANTKTLHCSHGGNDATGHLEELCTTRPKRQRCHADADVDVDVEGVPGGLASGSCPQCVELLQSWPDFESYLSVSRINVNVRQVNAVGTSTS